MTWKIVTDKTRTYVEKICNECGKVIETFDGTHPLTQYMIFDLQALDSYDLNTLDFGLQPYHWCPIKPDNHCLIPMKTTLRETRQEFEEEIRKQVNKVNKTIPDAFVTPPLPHHTPYKDPPKKAHHHGLRGRPPRLVLAKADLEEEEKNKEDESKSSV